MLLDSCIFTIYNIDEPIIKLDCFNENNRLVYSIPLLKIYSHEVELNNGRFKLFTEKLPGNRVFLRHDSRIDIPLEQYIYKIVNWINEVNKKNLWSFSGRMIDDYRSEFAFAFEDRTICFAFAMVWI